MLRGRVVLLHHLPEPVSRRPERRGGGTVLCGRGGPLEQLIVEHAVHVQARQQPGREPGRRGGRHDGRRHHGGRGDHGHRSVFTFHEVQRFHSTARWWRRGVRRTAITVVLRPHPEFCPRRLGINVCYVALLRLIAVPSGLQRIGTTPYRAVCRGRRHRARTPCRAAALYQRSSHRRFAHKHRVRRRKNNTWHTRGGARTKANERTNERTSEPTDCRTERNERATMTTLFAGAK